MQTFYLEKEVIISKNPEEVFAFFSRAENLEKVTPKHLHFQILTPLPIEMQTGCLIDYQLKIYGIPISWQSEITVWEPPFRFVDEQRRGPYKKWIHEHRFEKHDTGTRMLDTVEYALPGGWFAPIIHKLFVTKNLELIFKYREKKYSEIFTIESD
jgi:ligand-binding SRPBCC domain-containing protein